MERCQQYSQHPELLVVRTQLGFEFVLNRRIFVCQIGKRADKTENNIISSAAASTSTLIEPIIRSRSWFTSSSSWQTATREYFVSFTNRERNKLIYVHDVLSSDGRKKQQRNEEKGKMAHGRNAA